MAAVVTEAKNPDLLPRAIDFFQKEYVSQVMSTLLPPDSMLGMS